MDLPAAEAVAHLSREISVPEPIARILLFRGIDDYDKAKAYFRPSLDDLHDPFLMGGMEVAATRIIDGIRQGEKFFVFGDYDVDGTNGASMLYLFLRDAGATVEFYTPDRIKEGYGISRQGIDRAKESGVNIFLSIDCGITAIEQVEYAKGLGMDVIICDHHEPGEILPDALAVLDPIIPGDRYPFKSLCGCGVGFKLIQAVARRLGKESMVFSYLDFVTLASTADIVPLINENRILTRLGLEAINSNPRPGIRALIDVAGLRPGQITTGQIVFVLAPRINAVGRLGDAMRAVKLMTCTDPDEATELARVLEEENKNRRKIDEDTFAEAQLLAESLFDLEADAALVLHEEHWHPGVVGIVASRMVEKYYKPSIMMATVDGVAKGSARSISGFDVYQALKRCEEKIIQFGGHKYAAGLTVELDKLDEFRAAFNHAVREMMTEELRTPEIKIEVEISLADVTPRFMRILREFAPFGPGNMRPVFLARHLEVVGSPRIVGKNHLRFKVRQNGTVIDAIGFGLGDLLSRVPTGRRDLECVFTVEENDWNPAPTVRPGDPVPQLKIKDLR
ncbi:MAG: single-stranded-DNA-specific exonuclease RecJ [Bacteroidetes bacterium]|nr:single-stranded-DNA-specific exonuclease RecJ [Bacteroidota bacterium]